MLGVSCNRIVMRQQYGAVWNMEFCPQRAYKPGRITMLNLRGIQRIMHINDSWKDQAKRADSRHSRAHMQPTDSIRYQAYIIVRGSIYARLATPWQSNVSHTTGRIYATFSYILIHGTIYFSVYLNLCLYDLTGSWQKKSSDIFTSKEHNLRDIYYVCLSNSRTAKRLVQSFLRGLRNIG